MPCQSQSIKSVSIVHSTGRSISHDYPVNLSINLSVSVGACTKNNTRPRALTFAVRSSALLISSLSSSHLFDLSRAHITCLQSRDILRDRAKRILAADPSEIALCLLDRGYASETPNISSNSEEKLICWTYEKSQPRNCVHAEEHDEEGQESGTKSGGQCTDDRAGFLERSYTL